LEATAPTLASPDRLLRAEEVADMLGCSRSFVWRLIEAGQIDAVHVGRLRRIPASNVARYIAERIEAEHPAGA
jgi:excisionase family DNA binding protein